MANCVITSTCRSLPVRMVDAICPFSTPKWPEGGQEESRVTTGYQARQQCNANEYTQKDWVKKLIETTVVFA